MFVLDEQREPGLRKEKEFNPGPECMPPERALAWLPGLHYTLHLVQVYTCLCYSGGNWPRSGPGIAACSWRPR